MDETSSKPDSNNDDGGVHRDDGRAEESKASGPDEQVHPGKIKRLVVPREDIGAGIEASEELSTDDAKNKIRKPNRREWFSLNREAELPTRLLIHKPNPSAMDEEMFYVAPNLRGPIGDELKEVRVFPFISAITKMSALWVVKVTVDNSWYESLQAVLTKPASFFKRHEIRIASDKKNSRYRIWTRKLKHEVVWPVEPTDQLLGEALGEDGFINSADHPLYRDLVEGEELC